MKISTGRVLALIFLLATGCSRDTKSYQKYFDFDGLLDDQIGQLSQAARVLDKSAGMNGEPSDTTFLPSEKGWTSELEVFRQLEAINKPAYHSAYKVDDTRDDNKSNLKIRRYSSDAAPVHYVDFYYQDEFSRLRKIEAVITEKNLLYTNSRKLTLEFDEEENKPVLIRYSMNGFQKMIFRDTVRFSLLGEIDW